jgi:hypothetical protein
VLAEGVVAHDIPTSEAQNQTEDRKDWLALFSSRLHLSNTPAGTPWVWYQ